MLYDVNVSPSVFDAIRAGERLSLPMPMHDAFLGHEICFWESYLDGSGLTGCFVIVRVCAIQYSCDPQFPIEISWESPKKGK